MSLNAEDGGNRKYICVQLPEKCDEKSEAYKACYKTIAEISKERIRRASKKIQAEINEQIKSKENELKELENQLELSEKQEKMSILTNEIKNLRTQDLGFKVFKLAESNFKQWRMKEWPGEEEFKKQLEFFVDPVAEHTTIENVVYEFLLRNGKSLNSIIEHKENYHCINNSELILMLEDVNQNIIDAILKEEPQKVIALDKIFKGNDELKTNTVLQMRDANIKFTSV